MKRCFKLIIFIIFCFLFINCVDASSNYSNAVNVASNYLNNDLSFKKTYNRYLYPVTSNTSLFYKNSSESFIYGGLLSYEEFLITKNGRDNNNYSYLLESSEYWTYSGDNNNKNIVSSIINHKINVNDKSNVRVTEIVKPDVTVIGGGTYADPWVFESQYNVIIKTNNKDMGKLREQGSHDLFELYETSMSSQSEKSLYIEPLPGYEYLGNTCGIIVNDIDVRNGVSNEIKISSVSRDIECMINFGKKLYKINLVPVEYYYSEMSQPEPKELYILPNKSWYLDYSSVNSISKLYNVPSLQKHLFQGYYDVSNYNGTKFKRTCDGIQVIDKDGNLGSTSLTKNELSIYTDNMTLYPCFTPIMYTVKYDANGGYGSIDFTNCRVDEDCTIKENTFKRDGYTFIGWSTLSDSSIVSYNDKHTFQKDTMDEDITLYAVWKANTVTIKYSGAGNKITSRTKNNGITYNWAINSDNLVTKNGAVLTTVIKYNDKLGTDGLNDYNNSNFVNMKHISSTYGDDGYVGNVGKEWKCISNECNGKKYNQKNVYQASDFCDLTYGSCEVILAVNWLLKGVDVNGYLDGKEVYYLMNYATVDIWRNGKKIKNDASDYYDTSIWNVGDKFKIDDIKLHSNKVYKGVYSGKLEGKIGYDNSSIFPTIDTYNNDSRDTLRIYYNTGYDIGGFSTNFSISGKSRYSILTKWDLGWILDNENILIRRYEPNTSNISLYHYNDSNNFSIRKKLNGKQCYVNSGEEWNTRSDGRGVSLSQSKVYSYDELITYSIQKNNYKELNLYVNWKCN